MSSHHDGEESPFDGLGGPIRKTARDEEHQGSAEGPPSKRRGKRNRIHENNWGYTTYLDRVFGLNCFEVRRFLFVMTRRFKSHSQELVRLRVFPDAKDISESFGAIEAALRVRMIVRLMP